MYFNVNLGLPVGVPMAATVTDADDWQARVTLHPSERRDQLKMPTE